MLLAMGLTFAIQARAQGPDASPAEDFPLAGHTLNDGDLLAPSDFIFVGTLMNLGIRSEPTQGQSAFWRIKIEVLKDLKGRLVSSDKFELTVNVASGEGPPKAGKSYLFFAKKSSGIMTNIVKAEEIDPDVINAIAASLRLNNQIHP
jgi:hypothetical protein